MDKNKISIAVILLLASSANAGKYITTHTSYSCQNVQGLRGAYSVSWGPEEVHRMIHAEHSVGSTMLHDTGISTNFTQRMIVGHSNEYYATVKGYHYRNQYGNVMLDGVSTAQAGDCSQYDGW